MTPAAGARRAGARSKALAGHRQPAVDRADAGRHSGRHARDRRGRRDQCRAARRRDPGDHATRRLRERLDAWRAAQTAAVGGGARLTPDPLPPGATIGILGGGQLGRMLAHGGGAARATAAISTRPRPTAPAARGGGRLHARAPTTMPTALRRFAAGLRRRHLRVRERAGRGARRAGAQRCRSARALRALEVAQDRLSEKQFVHDLGGAPAAFARWTTAADARRGARRDRRAGDPQDPPARL